VINQGAFTSSFHFSTSVPFVVCLFYRSLRCAEIRTSPLQSLMNSSLPWRCYCVDPDSGRVPEPQSISVSLSSQPYTTERPGVRPWTELTAGGTIYCTIEDHCNLSVGRNEPKLNPLSTDISDMCPNRRRNQQLLVRNAPRRVLATTMVRYTFSGPTRIERYAL
jgi:hypothetical protein